MENSNSKNSSQTTETNNNLQLVDKQPKEIKKIQETITSIPQETSKPQEILKCEGNKHFMDVGNSGKWFNTEAEAIALYDKIQKEWGIKWENFEIDDATYYKNCPYRL